LKTLGVVTTTDDGTVSGTSEGKAEPAAFTEVEQEEPEPEVDVEGLFANAGKKESVPDLDAFWDDAVEKTGNLPLNPDVITFAEAQKLGLKPGEAPIKVTGPLRVTDSFKKKK
jgi:hypothetical protein